MVKSTRYAPRPAGTKFRLGGGNRTPTSATAFDLADRAEGQDPVVEEEEEEEEETPQLSVLMTVILLAVVTVVSTFLSLFVNNSYHKSMSQLVAVTAEWLVDSIDGMTNTGTISKEFVGVILLPIVGNAAEHVTAVTVSVKDKLTLSLGVAVGSSIVRHFLPVFETLF